MDDLGVPLFSETSSFKDVLIHLDLGIRNVFFCPQASILNKATSVEFEPPNARISKMWKNGSIGKGGKISLKVWCLIFGRMEKMLSLRGISWQMEAMAKGLSTLALSTKRICSPSTPQVLDGKPWGLKEEFYRNVHLTLSIVMKRAILFHPSLFWWQQGLVNIINDLIWNQFIQLGFSLIT